MELWIRSQDREDLLNIKGLYIEENKNKYYIFATNHGFHLGVYETKQRALEVLDEIQNILKQKYILDSSSIKPNGDSWVENGIIMQKYNANAKVEELSTYVYEMPKE